MFRFKQFMLRGNVLDLAVAVVMALSLRAGERSDYTIDRSRQRET